MHSAILLLALASPPRQDLPAPPPAVVPEGALVLFDGARLEAWRSLAGGAPAWDVRDGALVVVPGADDLVTAESFGDVHLHLDFLVPQESANVPDAARGNSGVFVADRWEIALLDSWQKDLNDEACGALVGVQAPAENAARPPGEWQSLDVTTTQRPGEPPRISAWLNDVRVLRDLSPVEPTPGGNPKPLPGSVRHGDARHVADAASSRACDWGEGPLTVTARFQTRGNGTLVSKCPPEGDWCPDAKALFLRGGRLVYDIGWVGAVTSRRKWNDGEWHTAVLTSEDGVVRMWVDGELEAERDDFAAEDAERFVLKVGTANPNFAGTLEEGIVTDVRFFDRALEAGEIGPVDELEGPVYAWADGDADAWVDVAADQPLKAPFRLQAGPSAVRFANIWVKPLGEVDHAGLLADQGPESYERGAAIYSGLCVACHGTDGAKPTNPKARPFALGELLNGKDPLSLFHTVTGGFQEMPGNAWLRPDQRYDVIHYVRETFLRERNPSQYVAVTDAYLNSLPKGRVAYPPDAELALAPRDYGPALGSAIGEEIGSALTLRLDAETTIAYDLQTMRSQAWTGGFLDLSKTHHYLQRGEGQPQIDGELLAGLAMEWGFGGTLDWDRSRRPERGPLPEEWLDYRGYYDAREGLLLDYAIDGRRVVELPRVDRTAGLPVLLHRFVVSPGDQELVLRPGEGVPSAVEDLQGTYFTGTSWIDGRGLGIALLTSPLVAVRADPEGTIRVPAATERTEFWLARFATDSAAELDGFRILARNLCERAMPRQLGYRSRWAEELVTEGALGEGPGPYVVDTLPIPESNPWNAWIRTSALDFFDDGRAAVATYGGDVWIVSGIDEDLDEVRWRRFAAGLFEPMGLKVVAGKVLVTCRDRIVRLHDLDADGEADFYENFFSDPDVSATFHAFSFDLHADADGYLYYAKSGQYTDYALPGAVLKIAPDGSAHEVFATGLRTPNGMGMSPDGRPLVSDNQGNWIPASKVSLTRKGGFYGVFKSINTNGPGIADRDMFDEPVIWLPQRVDSSSGGQLWLGDERFGPLAGNYLHTSFGKGWAYPLFIDAYQGVEQAAVYRLPFQFDAGLQRLRTNPADGQVYLVGLSGWQGPAGGADGCLQRLRYTGGGAALLVDAKVREGGLLLTFDAPLDASTAQDPARYAARAWNYRWTRSYGSAHYSVREPDREGEDELRVTGVRLEADGRTLRVMIEDLTPCHDLSLALDLEDAAGNPVELEVLFTIHRVHGSRAEGESGHGR